MQILNWLKKIFSLNFILLIVSLASLYIPLESYLISHSGDIQPTMYMDYNIGNNPRCIIITHTNDSVKLFYPQIAPTFLNISEVPIEKVNIKYTIESKIPYLIAPKLEHNKDFSIQSNYYTSDNTNVWSIIYNTDILYPNQSTPLPFKSIYFPPLDRDSLVLQFTITSEINSSNLESRKYSSFISTIQLSDGFHKPKIPCPIDLVRDSVWLNRHNLYQSNAISLIDNYYADDDLCDIIGVYHMTGDTTSTNGYIAQLIDVKKTDLDSLFIGNKPNIEYMKKHFPAYREIVSPKPQINIVESVFGILFSLILLVVWSIGLFKKHFFYFSLNAKLRSILFSLLVLGWISTLFKSIYSYLCIDYYLVHFIICAFAQVSIVVLAIHFIHLCSKMDSRNDKVWGIIISILCACSYSYLFVEEIIIHYKLL